MSESPFQKHVCILFISIGFITYYLAMKEKKLIPNKKPYRAYLNKSFSETDLEYLDFSDNHITTEYTGNISDEFLFAFQAESEVSQTKVSNVVNILGLFELSTRWGERKEGRSEILAAQIAIEHINRMQILPGYSLNLLVNDTQCDPGVGIDRFFYSLYSNKNILVLLGSSCSNVTESLAHIVPYWNIPQVSFGSMSPTLSDRNKFPLFFRTVAPDSSHNKAKIEFVKHFGWEIVAAFSQSENDFLLPINKLVKELELSNVSCVATITFSIDNYKEQLNILKNLGIRIILASFSSELAVSIFCEAFQLEIYGGDYVWILQHQQEEWWNSSWQTNECEGDQLIQATDGLVLVSDVNTNSHNGISESRMVSSDFVNDIIALNTTDISRYINYVYDAVWAIALALRGNRLIQCNTSKYDYQNRRPAVFQFMEAMESLNFLGLSGPIQFLGPDRVGDSILTQIQGKRKVQIAIYESRKSRLNFDCPRCLNVSWSNGKIPIAQRFLKVVILRVPQILYYFVCSMCLLGVSASFLFLFFSLRFRRVKSLKLSSPKLNNMAIFGCILVYCSIVLMESDEVMKTSKKYFTAVCSAKTYLLSSGFSLSFGSIFAKTYRVRKLFNNSVTSVVKTKYLKDRHLIILISTPVIIDAIILALWVVIDPMERNLHNLTLENFSRIGIVYQKQVAFCGSNNTSGWYFALYGYKCLVLIMGVFMAWENRRVKIPTLNDFQYIGICVYSALFAAIMLILSNFIAEYVILSYLTSSCSIILATSLTLVLMFLPQFKMIFGKVQNDDLIMRSMGLKFECNTRRLIHKDQKELLNRLEIQNRVFKCEIEALDEELKYLENLLKYSSSSKDSISDIYTISKPHSMNVSESTYGRASWPNSCSQSANNGRFSSEDKLNETFFERFRIFGRLKKFLGSLGSLSSEEDVDGENNIEGKAQKAVELNDCQLNQDNDSVISIVVGQIRQIDSDSIVYQV